MTWTEPNGERSFYRVQWTNGTTNWRVNVTETEINVTELSAGVKYSFTVIAVAGDKTESETAEIFHYTSKRMNTMFADHGASILFCVLLLHS